MSGGNKVMTTSGVASMLHLHINTVRRWSDQGILKGYRIGPRGDRRFMKEDIAKMLDSHRFGYKDWAQDS
jgi:excisionase family DNA binding protein